MSKRADAVAERLAQGANALTAFVASLPEDQWHSFCADEGRSVGVLVHHVASAYPVEVDLVRILAAGQPIAGVTSKMLDEMNARHAGDHEYAGRQATLALLRANSTAAADAIRALSDEQLDCAAPVSLHADAPLTAQYFIEAHPISHSFHHLASIRAAVAAAI